VPNVVPSLVAAGTLPDLDRALTGSPVTADHWGRTAGLIHHLWARASRARLSQSWQGDPADGSGGLVMQGPQVAGESLTQPWRCPLVSAAHTTLRAWVYCEHLDVGGGATGVIRLASAVGGAGPGVAVPVAPGWIVLTAPLAAAAVYDDVRLELNDALAANDSIAIYDLTLEIAPLASPLATIPVSTAAGGQFEGLGSVTLGGDYPLSSARLTSAVADLEQVYALPRVLASWVGVGTSAWVKNSPSYVMQRGRPYYVRPRVTADPEYPTATVWARCRRQAADTSLWLTTGEGGGFVRLPVPGGAPADVWVTGQLPLTATRQALSGLPDTTRLEFSRATGDGAAAYSTAHLLSLSVWGA